MESTETAWGGGLSEKGSHEMVNETQKKMSNGEFPVNRFGRKKVQQVREGLDLKRGILSQ